MRILASPAFKNRADNPYNAALSTALQAHGAKVFEFTWRRVLIERWDVAHIHWPEGALNTRGALKASVRALYLLAKLLYVKAWGCRLVWTVHNLKSHDRRFPRIERWFWKVYVPFVDTAIHLSKSGRVLAMQSFPNLQTKRNLVIPAGHYRSDYPNTCDQPTAKSRLGLDPRRPALGFIGQIRPYKNCHALVRAFLAGIHHQTSLVIAGIPATSSVVTELLKLTHARPEILCRFERIPDREIQFYLNACDLIVLPYTGILNSGSALLALSFNRPLLAPALGAMTELREMVGDEWVRTYTGELTPAILRDALSWALQKTRPSICDLGAFEWDDIGKQTIASYKTTLNSRQCPITKVVPASLPSVSRHSLL